MNMLSLNVLDQEQTSVCEAVSTDNYVLTSRNNMTNLSLDDSGIKRGNVLYKCHKLQK